MGSSTFVLGAKGEMDAPHTMKISGKLLSVAQSWAILAALLLLCSCMVLAPSPQFHVSDRIEVNTSIRECPDFPWPPPQASASFAIPAELVHASRGTTIRLGDVNDTLRRALEACGYTEGSYFAVPDGFALVTRLEQINSDGSPKQSGRWCTELQPLRQFSVRDYLVSLFFANTGLYRIIVFVVTPHPFSQSQTHISRDEMRDWLRSGSNRLPNSVARQEYTAGFSVTALVYEFEQQESQGPSQTLSSRITGMDHLNKSGFLSALGG